MEDLNAKWQRYDASRDEYVRGLHAQLRGLQAPHEPERPSPPELLRKEIARLNRQLEERISECADAKQELAALRSARDVALERAQMLEQQVPTPWAARTEVACRRHWSCGGGEVVRPCHILESCFLSDSGIQG